VTAIIIIIYYYLLLLVGNSWSLSSTQGFYPSGVGKSSTCLWLWLRLGVFACVVWQVTLGITHGKFSSVAEFMLHGVL